MKQILELEAGLDPQYENVTQLDYDPNTNPDIQHDLTDIPWPIADASQDIVVLHHVIEHLPADQTMREAARILQPGGRLEITVPIGALWFGNSDHVSPWNYRAPIRYSQPHHSEVTDPVDVPLRLVSREYESVWLTAPLVRKLSPLIRLLASRWPGPWVSSTPWLAGSLSVEYERLRDAG